LCFFFSKKEVLSSLDDRPMTQPDETTWYRSAHDNLADGFKLAMRRLSATVTIVSTGDEEGYQGLAATAVTSVCTEPPAVLACVNRSAGPSETLLQRQRFAINILHADNAALVPIFSGKIKGSERFRHGVWTHLENVPVLTDAQAVLVCTLAQTMDFGTHTILIGTVDAVRIREDIDPLIYQDGYLGRVVRRE
jgi:flavin reductase (DIM6/NTAB) family NADH-FMN oxidoreductase RutF